ncbi:MAG: cytochrome c oxidase subunit II [Acidobacteria bacterium]|nr:cytochrome c oxidase subunit II [Acidobacteriota bacterium]
MYQNSVFSPASPQASAIAHLSIFVGIVMVAILLLVTGLVFYAIVRFRRRPGGTEPRQVFGNSRMEKIWTFGALAVVTLLFVMTIRTMHRADPAPSPGEKPNLIIIAHQWWWEAHYTKSGVVAANDIHIPTGKAWLVRLESADVIHDWWVPDLGRKIDAIPGHPNRFWIEADKPGIYRGTCAEYCGAEHAWMRIRVVAQPTAEFQAWEQHQLEVPAPPTSGAAAQGLQLFDRLTCGDCHRVAGTSAQADIGPDLTHVASRATLAAGRLQNTPENLAKWISDPQAYKPGAHMPDFNFTPQQVHNLVAYLETLK